MAACTLRGTRCTRSVLLAVIPRPTCAPLIAVLPGAVRRAAGLLAAKAAWLSATETAGMPPAKATRLSATEAVGLSVGGAGGLSAERGATGLSAAEAAVSLAGAERDSVAAAAGLSVAGAAGWSADRERGSRGDGRYATTHVATAAAVVDGRNSVCTVCLGLLNRVNIHGPNNLQNLSHSLLRHYHSSCCWRCACAAITVRYVPMPTLSAECLLVGASPSTSRTPHTFAASRHSYYASLYAGVGGPPSALNRSITSVTVGSLCDRKVAADDICSSDSPIKRQTHCCSVSRNLRQTVQDSTDNAYTHINSHIKSRSSSEPISAASHGSSLDCRWYCNNNNAGNESSNNSRSSKLFSCIGSNINRRGSRTANTSSNTNARSSHVNSRSSSAWHCSSQIGSIMPASPCSSHEGSTSGRSRMQANSRRSSSIINNSSSCSTITSQGGICTSMMEKSSSSVLCLSSSSSMQASNVHDSRTVAGYESGGSGRHSKKEVSEANAYNQECIFWEPLLGGLSPVRRAGHKHSESILQQFYNRLPIRKRFKKAIRKGETKN